MMSSKGEPRIALIHDELTRRGGAEIVFEQLASLYHTADIYSLYAGQPKIIINGHTRDVQTSFLQNFPLWFRRHPGRLLPLLPYAAEQLDFSQYDLVISSASGFAKAIVTRANVPHLCYCHTPTRYLWEDTHDVLAHRSALIRWPAKALLHYLRLVDYTAAQRVDLFLANSGYTQRRIRSYYRRMSNVVYPPVDTTFFTPFNTPRKHFLLVGRLTRTKNFDQAIRVCEKLELPLVVIGRGYDKERLEKLAGKYTTFAGPVNRVQLRQYYRSAYALLQPGVEDFGLSSVEALASGTPVIAYNRGGVREIIKNYEHGYLYDGGKEEALAEAIRAFLDGQRVLRPSELQRQALHFSSERFSNAIYNWVGRALESN
jgi:glycosyltransferase involved in cell wall biosynthesis